MIKVEVEYIMMKNRVAHNRTEFAQRLSSLWYDLLLEDGYSIDR